MNEMPNKEPNRPKNGWHFRILAGGTVIFLVGLLRRLDTFPDLTNTDLRVALGLNLLIDLGKAFGCYLAFVSVVIGHKMLR